MHFYTHLVELESIIIEFDKLNLTSKQKIHLSTLLDSSLHHTVLDAILSELSNEEKLVFLQHLNENNDDKIWKFLNEKTNNIESKIKKVTKDLKMELQKDLKEAAKFK